MKCDDSLAITNKGEGKFKNTMGQGAIVKEMG